MRTVLVTALKILVWLLVVGLTSAYVSSGVGALILIGVPVLLLARRMAQSWQSRRVVAPPPAARTRSGTPGPGSRARDCHMCSGRGEPCRSCKANIGGPNEVGPGCWACGGRGRVACSYCGYGP
jgi:hypothetical protein